MHGRQWTSWYACQLRLRSNPSLIGANLSAQNTEIQQSITMESMVMRNRIGCCPGILHRSVMPTKISVSLSCFRPPPPPPRPGSGTPYELLLRRVTLQACSQGGGSRPADQVPLAQGPVARWLARVTPCSSGGLRSPEMAEQRRRPAD